MLTTLLALLVLAAAPSPAEGWYYRDGKHELGPLPLTALVEAAGRGVITADSVVWHVDGRVRRPARSVPELAAVLDVTPPPLPTAAPDEPPPLPPAKPGTTTTPDEPPPLPGSASTAGPPPLPAAPAPQTPAPRFDADDAPPAPEPSPSTPTPTPAPSTAADASPASTTPPSLALPATLGTLGAAAVLAGVSFDVLSPSSANHVVDAGDFVGPSLGLLGVGLFIATVVTLPPSAPGGTDAP